MYNYYYHGRKAYPFVLIWMNLALILCVGAVLYFILGFSILEQTKKRGTNLEEQKLALRKQTVGNKYDAAVKAVEYLNKYKDGKGIDEKFYEKFVSESLYPTHLYNDLLKNRQKLDMDVVREKLKDAEVDGLKSKIAKEELRVDMFNKIQKGFEEDEEVLTRLRDVVSGDYTFPIDTKTLVKNEDYSLSGGTKPYIDELSGESKNMVEVISLAEIDEKKAITDAKDDFDKKEKGIPEVVDDFFTKTKEFDEVSWEKLGKLTGAWKKFITKTKNLSDERRQEAIRIFNLNNSITDLNQLLDTKVKGLDWIPPLDLVDGEVMSVSNKLGVVMVNIGRKDGLRLNQTFDVLKVKGDVVQKQIARIQIKKLLHDISVARIIEQDLEQHIVAKDKIADNNNDEPFDRKIPPTYALRGTFFSGLSSTFIKHLIKISGGTINDKISKDTKYAIFGQSPGKDSIALCKKLGVRVLKERNLREHLGFTKHEINELKKLEWY
jgi:hypothetical protein